MTTKAPVRRRHLGRASQRVVLALIALVALAAALLLFTLWRTERAIVRELPPQAYEAITPMPAGTEPVVQLPTSTVPAPQPAGQPTSYNPATVPTSPPASSTPAAGGSSISEWNGKKRINVLVLGIDARSPDDSTRSDTIMLASLDFQSNTARVLSVPRDLYVNIPGFDYWKINAAYPIGENPEYSKAVNGGVGLLIRTLRQNFGIPAIDEFAIVNFQAFVQGVDALGGIDLTVPQKIVDNRYPEGTKYTRIVFEAGPQRMNGERALQYARTRTQGGDFARMKRQQQVILAAQEKAQSAYTVLKVPSLLGVVEKNLGTSLTLREQVRLARWAAQLPRENIQFYSIEGPIARDNKGQLVVIPQWEKINPTLRAVFGPEAGHR